MLSVSVQKDVGSMKSKVVGSLTARSLTCCIVAAVIGILIGCWCYFLLQIPVDIAMIPILLITLPIWAAGFWRPHGMNLEDFVPLWIKHNFGKNQIFYKPAYTLSGFGPKSLSDQIKQKTANNKKAQYITKQYAMLCKRPDFEAYCPPIDVDNARMEKARQREVARAEVEQQKAFQAVEERAYSAKHGKHIAGASQPVISSGSAIGQHSGGDWRTDSGRMRILEELNNKLPEIENLNDDMLFEETIDEPQVPIWRSQLQEG